MEATKGGNANESSNEKSGGNQQLRNIQHPRDPESSDDSRDGTDRLEIFDDDLIVQVLARLDGQSYRQAVYQDAGMINDNFLAPPHFPWYSRKCLPQKMTKEMPRDIDDLHVITHCQDELYAPFGDFQGPFGFGRYENGQSRGNYSNTAPQDDAYAAARRFQDPGVLELTARFPLPSPINALMSVDEPCPSPAKKWKNELSKNPDHVSMLSHLPFHWEKKNRLPPSIDQQKNSPSSGQQSYLQPQKLTEIRSKSKAQIRKWKISMKVGGVSSRSTLFPSSSIIGTDGDQDVPENCRKVIRPMLAVCSIQHGQTVTSEKALEMDNVGFAHSLGSHDCRYTDALLNPKKDGANRAKRIEVGRTRLVWSNLIQGDESSSSSTRNRVNFNSLLTGQRVDVSKCKRPTEVKVGLRLNGRTIMEEALEALPNVRKRKHSTRNAESDGPALELRIQCPESRTDEEIDAALLLNSSIGLPKEGRVLPRSTENGAVVYLEMGIQRHSDIDRNDIIASLLKFNQKKSVQKKHKRGASGRTVSTESAPLPFEGSQVIKKSNSPRFACVPLEDGLMRTVCLNAGNMAGIATHHIIREVLEQESEPISRKRCSVCWSDEGSGKEGVQECAECGLLAHLNCCLDRGEFSTRGSQDMDGALKHQNAPNKDGMQRSDDQADQWKCAVCCHYTDMKPRRNARMPSRFVDGETYASSKHAGDHAAANTNANLPGPQCSLCIHRGGAMSRLRSSHDLGHSQKWAHEVCRIWSGRHLFDNSKTNECSPEVPFASPLSLLCALCGTGGVKGDKSLQFNTGITKCAARGCSVAFHPMCALLASKVGFDEKGDRSNSRKARKKRHADQAVEDKTSDDQEIMEADKKLCKQYTLQLVQLTRKEPAAVSAREDKAIIIPVAFCGIHNPRRDAAFFGCLPGGASH